MQVNINMIVILCRFLAAAALSNVPSFNVQQVVISGHAGLCFQRHRAGQQQQPIGNAVRRQCT